MLIALLPFAAYADDNGAAREAFAHTPANGNHAWTLKDVSVKYTRSANGKTLESWTRPCKAARPFTVNGSF
ncbi:hypothetical protein ABTJ52_23415, partial [Acinetobacter baumannii]